MKTLLRSLIAGAVLLSAAARADKSCQLQALVCGVRLALRGAVRHHMYEEEAIWFPQLKKRSPAADQSMITSRFQEEFQRYSGSRVS